MVQIRTVRQEQPQSPRPSSPQGLRAPPPFYLASWGGAQGVLPGSGMYLASPSAPRACSAWPLTLPPPPLLPQPRTLSSGKSQLGPWSRGQCPGQSVWWDRNLGTRAPLSVFYLFSLSLSFFSFSLFLLSLFFLSLAAAFCPAPPGPAPPAAAGPLGTPSPTRQEKTARGLREQLESS